MLLSFILELLVLMGCVATPTWVPEVGVWYCEELQMQLSFEDDIDSYAVIGDKKVICGCGADRGSTEIIVDCQESNVPDYDLGEIIFWGSYVELNETTYTVKEHYSGTIYVFERIN